MVGSQPPAGWGRGERLGAGLGVRTETMGIRISHVERQGEGDDRQPEDDHGEQDERRLHHSNSREMAAFPRGVSASIPRAFM
jgi:hypothetical protein